MSKYKFIVPKRLGNTERNAERHIWQLSLIDVCVSYDDCKQEN